MKNHLNSFCQAVEKAAMRNPSLKVVLLFYFTGHTFHPEPGLVHYVPTNYQDPTGKDSWLSEASVMRKLREHVPPAFSLFLSDCFFLPPSSTLEVDNLPVDRSGGSSGCFFFRATQEYKASLCASKELSVFTEALLNNLKACNTAGKWFYNAFYEIMLAVQQKSKGSTTVDVGGDHSSSGFCFMSRFNSVPLPSDLKPSPASIEPSQDEIQTSTATTPSVPDETVSRHEREKKSN